MQFTELESKYLRLKYKKYGNYKIASILGITSIEISKIKKSIFIKQNKLVPHGSN